MFGKKEKKKEYLDNLVKLGINEDISRKVTQKYFEFNFVTIGFQKDLNKILRMYRDSEKNEYKALTSEEIILLNCRLEILCRNYSPLHSTSSKFAD